MGLEWGGGAGLECGGEGDWTSVVWGEEGTDWTRVGGGRLD